MASISEPSNTRTAWFELERGLFDLEDGRCYVATITPHLAAPYKHPFECRATGRYVFYQPAAIIAGDIKCGKVECSSTSDRSLSAKPACS